MGPVPGDLVWIIHRRGLLSFNEYGRDERFEVLVAETAIAAARQFPYIQPAMAITFDSADPAFSGEMIMTVELVDRGLDGEGERGGSVTRIDEHRTRTPLDQCCRVVPAQRRRRWRQRRLHLVGCHDDVIHEQDLPQLMLGGLEPRKVLLSPSIFVVHRRNAQRTNKSFDTKILAYDPYVSEARFEEVDPVLQGASASFDPVDWADLVLQPDGSILVADRSYPVIRIFKPDGTVVLAHGHTGIPLAHMLISATHTHTAPTAMPVISDSEIGLSTIRSGPNRSRSPFVALNTPP